MAKVAINTPAPDFSLDDFNGMPLTLAGFRAKSNILLVFNRGFV